MLFIQTTISFVTCQFHFYEADSLEEIGTRDKSAKNNLVRIVSK